ncbi:MAG: hypothetical protein JWM87_1947 [Candidatus Eremiobacteraeota bacterium]|jgi:hypothetical protein|nr:hypothetical protein [Candidatus Eremiobacteraeota bacterium]
MAYNVGQVKAWFDAYSTSDPDVRPVSVDGSGPLQHINIDEAGNVTLSST